MQDDATRNADADSDNPSVSGRAAATAAAAAAAAEEEWDWSTLSSRITSIQAQDSLQARLDALPHAWVLVFDADTDDEAVYSMELEEHDGAHVVLAFEDREEAESYAESLAEEDGPYGEVASVQALDVEALVVTSRDADFRVGIVFRNDLQTSGEAADDDAAPLILTSATPPRVSVSITMIPEGVFAGKTSEDFLDPDEDPVWVLVHDEGTADAQFFSMVLNGTSSVVCFKDEASAQRCGSALGSKNAANWPSARAMLLEELLDAISPQDDVEVCLVDEVVETIIDDAEGGEGGEGGGPAPGTITAEVVAEDIDDEVIGQVSATGDAQQSNAAPANVRDMLERLYSGDPSEEPPEP